MDKHPANPANIQPPATPDHKNRVRFGESLPWPFSNAGVFVVYMTDAQWSAFQSHIESAKAILEMLPNGSSIANHVVCELS